MKLEHKLNVNNKTMIHANKRNRKYRSFETTYFNITLTSSMRNRPIRKQQSIMNIQGAAKSRLQRLRDERGDQDKQLFYVQNVYITTVFPLGTQIK
mgnify:CR=1 FL=1